MSRGQKIGVFVILSVAVVVVLAIVFRANTGDDFEAVLINEDINTVLDQLQNDNANAATETEDDDQGNTNTEANSAVNAADTADVADTPDASPSAELSGSFVAGAHDGAGTVRIEEKNGKKMLIFSSDFTTEDGPDLRVFLSGAQSPQSSADLHAEGDADLGKLKAVAGAQEYEIPAELDFDPASVVVYCVPFKVVFGFANLNK